MTHIFLQGGHTNVLWQNPFLFMNKRVFCSLGGAVCSAGRRDRLFWPIRCSFGPQVGTRYRTCSLRKQRLHGTVWGPESYNRSVDFYCSSVQISILSVLQCFSERRCYQRGTVFLSHSFYSFLFILKFFIFSYLWKFSPCIVNPFFYTNNESELPS